MSDGSEIPVRYQKLISKWSLILFLPAVILDAVRDFLFTIWENLFIVILLIMSQFLVTAIVKMIRHDIRWWLPYTEEAMGDITSEQYKAVPRYAEEVLAGKSTEATALSRFALDVSLNERSAMDYLQFYLGLHRGIFHERTVQISAVDYYMSLFDKLDNDKKARALRSLSAYVKYYKRAQKVIKPKFESVLLKWSRAWET